MIDYNQLEQQASDVIRLQANVLVDWQRTWTNEARRELQRKHNFQEMAAFYPVTEDEIGDLILYEDGVAVDGFVLSAGVRRITAPTGFKEFYGEKDGLFWVTTGQGATGEHTPIPQRSYEWLMENYSLSDTGEPEFCQLIRLDDGVTTYIDVWPKPDDFYALRLHGYKFMEDLDATATLVGVSDFLLEKAPLALRDALLREAYMALEMRDLTLFAAQGSRVRQDEAISDSKDSSLPDTSSLIPSLNSGWDSQDQSEWGYPFWRKR